MKACEHISLIGMSNIGKSHWGRLLAQQAGFEHIECDALIEKKLEPELAELGYKGLRDVAKWMGQPFDPQYPYTSQKYLATERQVMLDIIERLKAKPDHPLVIDTTGSVVYVGDDVVEQLKSLTRVVYFEATAAHVEKLFERYIANPKPVIWGESFKPESEESLQEIARRRNAHLLAQRARRYSHYASNAKPVVLGEAVLPGEDETLRKLLLECYPKLLAFRSGRYRSMADICAPFDKHSDPRASWKKLMADT